MRRMISLVLGGGKGTRLQPLTTNRSKPAVPLAGKYRLIDIPISNCINAGINRIYVLTQFNSVSLHRHIRQTYNFDRFDGGFVEILAAQQTSEEENWYQGTADAVRKQLRYVEESDAEYVLILSGDQLYRMDYDDMLRTHRENKADVTIGALPVDRKDAAGFGIMRLDDDGRVLGFLEKPQTERELEIVRTDPAWIDARGIASKGRDCLASMGIYLFNRDTLIELLKGSDYRDFGREVFPLAIRTRRVQVHLFDGYWEDIGTIRAFYECNLALASPNPPFDFAANKAPIYTHARSLPPTRIAGATVKYSLVADGCHIDDGAVIENSVIGLRTRVGKGAVIRSSVVMGTDFFESDAERRQSREQGPPPAGVGEGSVIEGTILDKNVRIGRNVRIVPPAGFLGDSDHADGVVIRDGVVWVQKNAVLKDGWRL
jgi:glucose-1-phosphate adenylyltransferase